MLPDGIYQSLASSSVTGCVDNRGGRGFGSGGSRASRDLAGSSITDSNSNVSGEVDCLSEVVCNGEAIWVVCDYGDFCVCVASKVWGNNKLNLGQRLDLGVSEEGNRSGEIRRC